MYLNTTQLASPEAVVLIHSNDLCELLMVVKDAVFLDTIKPAEVEAACAGAAELGRAVGERRSTSTDTFWQTCKAGDLLAKNHIMPVETLVAVDTTVEPCKASFTDGAHVLGFFTGVGAFRNRHWGPLLQRMSVLEGIMQAGQYTVPAAVKTLFALAKSGRLQPYLALAAALGSLVGKGSRFLDTYSLSQLWCVQLQLWQQGLNLSAPGAVAEKQPATPQQPPQPPPPTTGPKPPGKGEEGQQRSQQQHHHHQQEEEGAAQDPPPQPLVKGQRMAGSSHQPGTGLSSPRAAAPGISVPQAGSAAVAASTPPQTAPQQGLKQQASPQQQQQQQQSASTSQQQQQQQQQTEAACPM